MSFVVIGVVFVVVVFIEVFFPVVEIFFSSLPRYDLLFCLSDVFQTSVPRPSHAEHNLKGLQSRPSVDASRRFFHLSQPPS